MTKHRLYQSVVQEIRQLIESGEWPAGSRLPGERELAERFNVSRVTIREAEIALEALGLIRIKTGSGAYVEKRDPTAGNAMPNVTAFELTAARLIIEAEAAALAAANLKDEDAAELRKLVAAMTTSHGDEEGDDHDRQFHLAIARISGNPVLEHLIRQMWRMRNELPQVKQVYASVCKADAEPREQEHRAILEALERRDPAASRQAMREHFHRLFEAMLDATEASALEEVRRRIGENRKRFLMAAQV